MFCFGVWGSGCFGGLGLRVKCEGCLMFGCLDVLGYRFLGLGFRV